MLAVKFQAAQEAAGHPVAQNVKHYIPFAGIMERRA
jgi:hypothetical protein